ncbi:hypothetical protein CHS0354_028823 [Potamilus streckersoni]|uniref:Chitobiosyldiphosphodolichol beta-mannosyltransferase n=1 Tax=Potamilus streckersoni TaxID=2493646 RepID=A0AAE0RY92_9BIVA|nr:hypothetical protein CHS0354_028823 [Potamilus streckersoni]
MQYHALSFWREGFHVDLVGYAGSEVQRELVNNDDVSIYYLTEPPVFLKKLPRLLCYVTKVFFQSVSLGVTLLLNPKCGYILIQNPPSIPTIAVSVLVCLLRWSHLVIDWHNYGYTILGLTLGDQHPLVRFSRWYEYFFGKFSQDNICVTNAMREDLSNKWKIKAHVMYDRSAAMFGETSLESNHDLFRRLSKDYPIFRPREKTSEYCTVFTQKSNGGEITYIKDRPALLVSSTSWTEDEDFDILLDALQDYDARKQKLNKDLPDLICVITGKGPLKDYYSRKIEALHLKHVQFCLPWLSTEDYPLLLGCADLGVCLHKSSSGLDLPMKVVDMFGCGLPVCAIHFNCLPELVVHGENGIIFKDSGELCQHLQDLLQNMSFSQSKLKQMRQNLKSFQSKRWHDCWRETVLPLFIDSSSNKRD